MPRSANNAAAAATKASDAVQSVENDLVEVKLAAEHTLNVVINDVRVSFEKGVATVKADIAKALKDAGFVK